MNKILSALILAFGVSMTSHATTPPVGCTYDQYGRKADGSTLWATTDQGIPPAQQPPFETNCLIDQFSYNNFLYLTSDDGSGHPKFMSMIPWYNLLPAKGEPVWTGKYASLKGTKLNKTGNQIQAGDTFELLDVNNQVTSYDMRVNQVFFDYVKSNKVYTQKNMDTLAAAFKKNSYTNGVWLPPTSIGSKDLGAIEIKTSWRSFGPAEKKLCPGDIMHCEVDGNKNEWGMVGFHLVQKTNTHGEMVWATFEHTANAPDCTSGGSNSIAQYPIDPTDSGKNINVNKYYKDGTQDTGWNYFDYNNYKKVGGDGNNCAIPTQNGASPICLTSPLGDTTGTWRRVEVCRTDILASIKNGCAALTGQEPNSQDIACLNNSVVSNSPSTMASKWKYYKLVGMEWAANGNTEGGGFPQGCFTLDGAFDSTSCPNFPKHGESSGAPKYTRTGSTTMANTTMETWMQDGINLTILGGPYAGTYTGSDCFGCHKPHTTSKSGPHAPNTNPSNQGDMSHIFSRIHQ
ncbi:MAG: hypothetical protein M0Q44_07550 [Methylobacter sp.]|jgi:hypothetical protein|nr:hypothetical protein [Methylobacter sp.]